MEKNKQLNLSAPLLSVRRHSSPLPRNDVLDRKVIEKSQGGRHRSLSVKKSGTESEAVAKPASVPFIWENAPGRPKGECKTRSSEEPSSTPRLPPGRLSDASWRYSEVYSPRGPLGRLSSGRHQSGELCNQKLPPGRLSGEVCRTKFSPARLTSEVCSPRLPSGKLADVRWRSCEVQTQRLTSGRSSDLKYLSGEVSRELHISKYQPEAFAVTDHASLLESLKESLNADMQSGDNSDEDEFSDALDTLSPTESLSLNCSVSGSDNFYDGQNRLSSGSVSVDPQARDHMMKRFITAAKAAVVETPKHVLRKQTVVIEEPKIVEKVISLGRKTLIKQPGFDSVIIDNQYSEDVKSEDEVDLDEPRKSMGKICGLFPRLCVRNSLSVLHQVPETKSKTQPSTPSRDEVKKLTRNCHSRMKLKTQPSSPSFGEVKKHTRNAYSGPIDKCASEAFYKKNYHSGFLSQELHKVGKKLMDEPNKRISSSGDLYNMAEGRSSSTRSRSGVISPYRNERSPSPFREGARFLGLPKEVEQKAEKISSLIRRDKILLEVSSIRSHKQGSEPSRISVEETLYVDAVHSNSTPNINEERSLGHLSRNLSRSHRTPLHSVAKSSREDKKQTLRLEQGTGENPEYVSPGMVLSSSSCNSKLSGSAHEVQKCIPNQHPEQENSSLGFKALKKGDGNLILKKNASKREQIARTENSAPLIAPLPPPLPRSPSESWLWRTLPSIPFRNPFSHSQDSSLHLKKQSQKQETPPSPKWEIMVKSSKVHHDRVRYSEELVSHIPRLHDRR